ncbi:hypothetical protein GIB67_015736 [Kingdonia uniflora]|uniref:Protein FAR1-RELATED SEQUENCE n=1 Tax=Kingdonia uniflora TaxID=39325 RepID=A0A7J7NUZ4_9MAGN|nr:hypothetical protein GIB67_015736 [Kingdonia uniflora]
MEEAIFDSERVAGDERSDLEMDMAHPITESYWQNDISQGKRELLPPVVGMEFETYDDAYNLYNHYAIDFGFAVRFQYEVEEMYSCFNTAQVHSDGPVTTYIVKERVKVRENTREIRDYEVIYNTDKVEVSCICGWFNFKGYLCRHALSVLNHNGMEEIPSQYILSRWKKDIKRTSVLNHVSNHVNVHDSLQRYDHLYKRAFHIVEEGTISREHYKVALEALEDSLNKICLVKDAESSTTTLRGEPCVSGNVSGHDPLQKEEVIQQTQIPWRYFIEKVCRDARKKIINDKRKGIETQGAELVNPRLQPIAPKPPYPGILVSTQEDSQAIDTQGAKLVNSRLRPISPKPPNPGKLVSTQEGLSQPVIGFGQYNPDRIVRKTLLTGAFRSSMGQSLELPCHSNLYRRLDTEAPRGDLKKQSECLTSAIAVYL